MKKTKAFGTMPRATKGPAAPPPALTGALAAVATAVSAWPGVKASTHWHLIDRSRVDGVDFYVGDEELGHLHLDGSLHLATRPALGETLVAAGVARRFAYQRGWVCEDVETIGTQAAIALFERNYVDLVGTAATA